MVRKPLNCSTRYMCFAVEYMDCGRDRIGAKFGKNNAFGKTAVV